MKPIRQSFSKILNKILYSACRLHNPIGNFWRYRKFLLFEKPTLNRFEIGCRNLFEVQVRVDGQGELSIGSKNIFGHRQAICIGNGEILLQPRTTNARVSIGSNNNFSNNVSLVACGNIQIGDNCLIGDQVSIFDCDFHDVAPKNRRRSVGEIIPVKIGDNVWIGSRSIILKGVTIGDNSVVGAMSIVTRSIPANSVVAGNPAKIIRYID